MNYPEDYQKLQSECEYQNLIAECRSLIALIAQKPYATKLLRSVRQGLLMHLGYKGHRRR